MYDLNHFDAHFTATNQSMPDVVAREYADALKNQSMMRQASPESAIRRRFVVRLVRQIARMASKPALRWNPGSQ